MKLADKSSGEVSGRPSPLSSADPFDFSFPLPSAAKEFFPADDIFLHGRLLPLQRAAQPLPASSEMLRKLKVPPLGHRRAESLDCHDRRRGYEYQKLRRASSETRSRPRWLLCLMGTARFPPEMEMKDMKVRQRRRNPNSPAAEKCGAGKIRWGILQSLSCKAAESTVVAVGL
ncbi:hypothetical protein AXF42_Ash016645 [Apostasia shenzhenica]|uniref:Uncharacterized protein n=1 Tax=Apostasia shenzhenica TaxID=1088818 RepID=A0A2I0A1P3_9ASPA|nr:hypothetical protein AXF42_Ash016645 [Apostasia shenzhenica]